MSKLSVIFSVAHRLPFREVKSALLARDPQTKRLEKTLKKVVKNTAEEMEV
jgi:hypothetical protein